MKNSAIICVSTNYWYGEWFRKQQFMRRFARDGSRVLYVEPSHSMIRSSGDRPYVHNSHFKTRLAEVEERLWVLTPRTMIPLVTSPVVSRINAALLAMQIRTAMRCLGFEQPLLWVYPVEFAPAVGLVPHERLVSDLVDDLVAYELRSSRKAYVSKCTKDLVAKSDLAVYTTAGLRDIYPGAGETAVVPNGYDEALFHPGIAVARELRGMKRVAGFVGTLFRHLDFDLFRRVATEIPDVTLVLVGRVAGSEEEMRPLMRMHNVVHIPAVERSRVPEFIAGFDVCLVPFRRDEVSKNVSPLKAYEYLAMGKPTVSVPMPALAEDAAAGGVRFARDGDEFVRAVCEALDAESDSRLTCDSSQVVGAAWEGRYNTVVAALSGSGPASSRGRGR